MFLVWRMQFFAWLSKRGRYKCHLHFPSPFKSDSLIYFEEGNLVPRLQGDPIQNLLISNDYNSETMHFWPYVGKVKLGLPNTFCLIWKSEFGKIRTPYIFETLFCNTLGNEATNSELCRYRLRTNLSTWLQCANYGNLLSRFFDKKFVKPTFLLNKLPKRWFHEIEFSVRENFPLSTLMA